MGLIKAAAYALLGFVLYELFVGLSQGTQMQQGSASNSSSSPRKRRVERALNEDKGRTAQTHEAGGAASRKTVGRGAV
jgi:hypothetical protein